MFGIGLCLIGLVAVSFGDKVAKASECYDCHYDPDIDKHRGGSWGHFPGFPKCAMYDSVEIGDVDRWPCKTGKCFIRQDPNGLLYRGCADPSNLPWGVDSMRNCHYQGQIPSLWYFCDGDLCNGGSGNICSDDNSGLDDFFVETVHGTNNRPEYDTAEYGEGDRKFEYQSVPEQDGSFHYGYNDDDDVKYQLPPDTEKPSGVDFEFYSEQYMNENNVPRIDPASQYQYGGYDNKKQDVPENSKKSGFGSQNNGKASVTQKQSQNKKTDVVPATHKKSVFQPQPQKKEVHQKSQPPMQKSQTRTKKTQPPMKKSQPSKNKSQPPVKSPPSKTLKSYPPIKKSTPPMQTKNSKYDFRKSQSIQYSKDEPHKKQYNFETPSYPGKKSAKSYEPVNSNQKKSIPPPKYYQQQNPKSYQPKSKSDSSSAESEDGYKTGNGYYKSEQSPNKYPQPNHKSQKIYKSQKPHYKSEGPGPEFANGGIYTDRYEPEDDFGAIHEPFPLDYYESEDKYYQQQPKDPYTGAEKSGYDEQYGDNSQNKFGINDKFMGSPDPVYKEDLYNYGDDTDDFEYGYQPKEEPEQSVYEGIISNAKTLSYVAKTMLSAMEDSFDFVDRNDDAVYNPCDGRCHNNPSGLFAHPSDNKRFIQCGDGMEFGKACRCCKPYFLGCPYGTIFDAYKRVCTSSPKDSHVNGKKEYGPVY